MLYATGTALFGGTTQPVITWLIHRTGDVLWPGWYLMAATAVGLAAMMAMKESAPVSSGEVGYASHLRMRKRVRLRKGPHLEAPARA